jgi:hypothetical protein
MSMRMLFVTAILLASCGGSATGGPGGSSDAGGGSVSYDGNWSVLVQINSCYSFSNTATVTVSGSAFSGTLFTYCANAQTGATRLSTTGCGSDISETVSIQQGTMSGSSVAGNLFLTGGACNGGNGFSGGLSAASGQAGSFWGTLAFTKM